MKGKKRNKAMVGNVVTEVVLILLALLFLLPIVWMFATSLKTQAQMTDPTKLFAFPASFRAYVEGWGGGRFLTYIKNTVVISVLCVTGTLISCSLAAFGFAKFQVKGKNIIFMVVLATMMVPTTVTLIPMYILYSKLHWLNTITPLVLPSFFGASAYNIFLLRQFFAGLPNELSEAAAIDGAGWLRIYSQIYMPNAKPALIVVVINQLVFCWNDYMGPLIYLGRPANFTIALGLNAFKGEMGATMDIGPLMAMAFVTILPVLLLYLFFQRYFVEGVAASGIKG